jgi:serine/threonine protein kinase
MQLVGQTIGHYNITDILGAGGMATVYRAEQTNIEREVAIKVMAPAFAQQPEFVKRFKQEAALFAKLEHPHILPIYDYGEQDGHLYLVLRVMDGGSLERQVTRRNLKLTDIAKLVTQIASALDYAHTQEVIHRDLKPNNVLLDTFGNAYLMDFGIAKILSGARMTATGTLLGTPAYMAPEQWKMEPIDGRVDVYSLGVMLYELLTGDLPFDGTTPFQFMYAHLHEAVPPASRRLKGLPDDIDDVIYKATAKLPDERYATATTMAHELEAAARRIDTETVSITAPAKTKSRSEQLGKILVALERSDSGLYAIPKVEDFIKPTPSRTKAEQSFARMEDIFGSLDKPSTGTVNTSNVSEILSQGRVNQAFMGISAQPVNLPTSVSNDLGQTTGLLIIGVDPDSPAEKGGLHIGDILVTLASKPVRSQDDLKAILRDEYVGSPVAVQVVRAGQRHEFAVIPTKPN